MSAVIHTEVTSHPRFYSTFGLAIALVVVVGFSRTYYLRFLADLPALPRLLHLHGLVSSALLALFVTQTKLVAARRVDLHRKFGILGVALALIMMAVNLAVIAVAATAPGVRPSGLTAVQFTAIPMVTLVSFATFFGLALASRRHVEYHKRFMVLAMVAVLGPGVARLALLLGVAPQAFWLQLLVIALFVGACIAHDWRHQHRVHPVFLYGGAALLLAWPLRMMLARSEWWTPVGEWLKHLGT
jgi:hypothetical protein